MIKNCPNCNVPLVKRNETTMECSQCGYSMSATPSKGNKHIQAVNRQIKRELLKLRMKRGTVESPFRSRYIYINKRNYDTDRFYNGINRLILAFSDELSYLTRKSIEQKGYTLKENAEPITIVTWITPRLKKDEKSLPKEEQERILNSRKPFMVSHIIYKAKDVIGLPEKIYPEDKNNSKYENVEEFIKTINIPIKTGGNITEYDKEQDVVYIPDIKHYNSTNDYYKDLFKLLAEATAHESRLDRDADKYKADEKYGREELITEIASAYMCHAFNIPVDKVDVEYINNWLKAIEGDAYLLTSSAQQAEKIFKFFKLI